MAPVLIELIVTSRVFVTTRIGKPDIVAGPSQMESQRMLLVHDEGICRLEQAMLQNDNIGTRFHVRGLDSEHSLIIAKSVLMSVTLVIIALLND